MNWVINGVNSTITEEWDMCDHLSVGMVAPYWLGEQDSFGPVVRYGMCKECNIEHQKVSAEETEHCTDCGNEFKVSEGITWRWYDFYAPQGDEPLHICNECTKAEKHKNRIDRDIRNMESEFGQFDELD